MTAIAHIAHARAAPAAEKAGPAPGPGYGYGPGSLVPRLSRAPGPPAGRAGARESLGSRLGPGPAIQGRRRRRSCDREIESTHYCGLPGK